MAAEPPCCKMEATFPNYNQSKYDDDDDDDDGNDDDGNDDDDHGVWACVTIQILCNNLNQLGMLLGFHSFLKSFRRIMENLIITEVDRKVFCKIVQFLDRS